MRIAEVSARTGLPATTLRFYESVGLLTPAREPNGYRSYDEQSVAQVRLIEAAKQLGLRLPEIGALLDVMDGQSCTAARHALTPRLVEHLSDIDARLSALHALRRRVSDAIDNAVSCPDSERCCRTECALQLPEVDAAAKESPPSTVAGDQGPGRRATAAWTGLAGTAPSR